MGYANPNALTEHDVRFLRRIFEKTALDDDTDLDQDVRATELVRLFQEGMASEAELLERLDRRAAAQQQRALAVTSQVGEASRGEASKGRMRITPPPCADEAVPSREWLELGVGVVSGVINLESSGVEAPDRRPRHDKDYHECRSRSS